MPDPIDRIREYWNLDAAGYDGSPSHSMSDPVEAAAWRTTMEQLLPPSPARVLDVGAGTGALSLLAAELGHEVTALDLSPAMLARVSEKAQARGLDIRTVNAAATDPPAGPFDAVIERHVVWTLPDPATALAAWRRVAADGGRLVLFEGVWNPSGAAARVREVLRRIDDAVHRRKPDHHAPYPPEIVESLPLGRLSSLDPMLEAVRAAGWRSVRAERLPAVESAARRSLGPISGPLAHRDRYAVLAEA